KHLMKLIEMTWPEVEEFAETTVALWPLAAIEQHGPHLSLSTDEAIVTRLSQQVEEKVPNDVVLCPTLPFGSSHHHLSFAGTMSLPADILTSVIVELVKSLVSGGFRRIILLNGHGGNITPARQALSLLSHELDIRIAPNIAIATYWELGGKAFSGESPMESPALSHACEYETSLMLYLFPERVHLERARRSRRPARNGYIAWEDDEPYRGVSLFKKTEFLSSNGSSGEPQLATPAKGEFLYRQATDALARFISQFKTWPLMNDLRGSDTVF